MDSYVQLCKKVVFYIYNYFNSNLALNIKLEFILYHSDSRFLRKTDSDVQYATGA